LIAGLALVLAIPKIDLVTWVVGLAMAVCLGSFMVQMVLGLYWRRGTGAAALWAMILGFTTTVAWAILFGLQGEHLYYIHPSIPGTAVNWAVFIVVSLLSKPLPKEHLDRVFGTEATIPS
jgi:Na+/proline symporter